MSGRHAKLVEELGKALVKTGALRFGTFTLPDGRTSSYYIDLKVSPSLPSVFKLMIRAFKDYVEGVVGKDRFDVIGAIPLAGLTYASVVAYELDKPLVYLREPGTVRPAMKRVEGAILPGQRVLILDDLAMSGASISRASHLIRAEGALVKDAVVLIDRMEGAGQKLAKEGIKLRSIAKVAELAALLRDRALITEDQYRVILGQARKS